MTFASNRRKFTLSALGLAGLGMTASFPSFATTTEEKHGTLTGHCVQGMTQKMQLGKAALALGLKPLITNLKDKNTWQARIQKDYAQGRTHIVDAWTLSNTEARLFAGYASMVS